MNRKKVSGAVLAVMIGISGAGAQETAVPASPDWLRHDDLTTLSVDEAKRIMEREGRVLSLDGLKELSPEAAKVLAGFKGEELDLMGLQTLPAETAKALAACKCDLGLNGLTSISDEAANELYRNFMGRRLILKNAKDAPESLRLLVASRKVSDLVLPFTNTRTLPSDWQERLIPPIEEHAAEFPDSRSADVYFSRLVRTVEAQAPAAMPALVERMASSPSVHVRELAAKRRLVLEAMKRPLELKFTALDGREVDTTKWRGKVVIVDFWASYCSPCIAAMPHLKDLYAKYHDRGLEIVNISVDKEAARDSLVKLVAKLELPWPQFFDGKENQGEFAVRYGVQPIPHLLLFGPDGMIAAVTPGYNALEAEIRRLLKITDSN